MSNPYEIKDHPTIRELVVEHRKQTRVAVEASRDEAHARVEIHRLEKEIVKHLQVDAHTYQRTCIVPEEEIMIQVHYHGSQEDRSVSFLYPDPERPGEWTVRREPQDI